MDLRTVAKQIKTGNISPVYLLYGTESFLMGEMVSLLESQIIASGEQEFLLSRYDLQETPLEHVVEEAETFPFLGGTKCIIATNAIFLTALKDTAKIEHRLESLTLYLDSPVDHSVIIFCVPHNKLDERKGIVKSLKKVATVCSFQPLEGATLHNWVVSQGKKFEVEWEPDAVSALIGSVGPSLQRLYQEVNKLATYVGQGNHISREIVEHLVSRTLDDNVFALTDYVSKVEIENAFRLLHDLLQQKEDPIKLTLLLARQFRIMLQVKELSARGYGQQQMATTLGLHPYPIKLAMDVGQRYEIALLHKILNELAEVDYKVKTGQIDKVLALELFLLQLGDWIKRKKG
jgi:DNA polymerase-3 subunit delta